MLYDARHHYQVDMETSQESLSWCDELEYAIEVMIVEDVELETMVQCRDMEKKVEWHRTLMGTGIGDSVWCHALEHHIFCICPSRDSVVGNLLENQSILHVELSFNKIVVD